VYSHGVAQYYDLFASTADAPPEAPFLRALLPQGSAILDVGAGTGTLAFVLAAEGYKVTALEPDPEMYAAMLVRLSSRADLRANVTPVPKPLGFELGARFEACLSLAVLHLLDAPEQAALFRFAASHLRPGGRFLVETPVDSPLRDELAHQLKAECTCGDTHYRHYYSMARRRGGRWCTTWEFVATRGEQVLDRRTREFDWRPSSLTEVNALATSAGLVVKQTFADFAGAPFVAGESGVLVVVAGAE
jgi:SAM-dependent methyltransferase